MCRSLEYIMGVVVLVSLCAACAGDQNPSLVKQSNWVIDSQEEWEASKEVAENLDIVQGRLEPIGKEARYLSRFKKFSKKQKLKRTF